MRVLVFGDSITQGFWDTKGGWASRVREYFDSQKVTGFDSTSPIIFNLGISGNKSDDLLARLENETKVRVAKELAFIIAIGVNDTKTQSGINYSNTGRYKQNLSKILDKAKKYSDKIMFVGLTPCGEGDLTFLEWGENKYTNDRIKKFDDTLHQFCLENQVPLVKIYEPFLEAKASAKLLEDGLHPNDEGHQFIAELVLPKLKTLIAEK